MDSPAVDYLEPLFELASSLQSDDAYGTTYGLGTCPPGSVLAYDDALTAGFHLSTLLVSRVSVALDHILTLQTVVTRGGVLTALAPWTLLRSALESATAALWLGMPTPRGERVLRTLRVWHEVARERASWERDSQVSAGEGESRQLQDEVLKAASDGGLDAALIRARPSTYDCIQECSTYLGLEPHEAVTLWRESSGVSHGYDWATLGLTSIQPREKTEFGLAATMRINETRHARLASLVRVTLEAAILRYAELCQAAD